MTDMETQLQTPNSGRTRGRLLLLLVAAIFLGPVIVSMAMYFGADDWRPDRTTNHGELIAPVRALPEVNLPILAGPALDGEAFLGRWTLIMVSGDGCAAPPCANTLINTRQVRTLLGRNSLRVRRILLSRTPLADDAAIAAEHPDLSVMDVSGPDSAALLAALPRNAEEGAIFLSDPNANLVLRFAPGSEAKALQEDLKRLLKLSRIG